MFKHPPLPLSPTPLPLSQHLASPWNICAKAHYSHVTGEGLKAGLPRFARNDGGGAIPSDDARYAIASSAPVPHAYKSAWSKYLHGQVTSAPRANPRHD